MNKNTHGNATDQFLARMEIAKHIYTSVNDPRMSYEERQYLAAVAWVAAANWPIPKKTTSDSVVAEFLPKMVGHIGDDTESTES